MKTILYVFGGEQASGGEFVIENLVRYNTPERNHLVMSPGNYYDKLCKNGTPYKLSSFVYLKKLNTSNLGKFKALLLFIRNTYQINRYVNDYTKKNKIGIVHANTMAIAFYLLPLVIWNKIFRRKTTFIWSDHDLSYPQSFLNRMVGLVAYFYDKTLVVSNAVRRKYQYSTDKIIVLYNGLKVENFVLDDNLRQDFRNLANIPTDAVVIGILGSIIKRKGVLELVEVFKKIFASNPTVYLVVIGAAQDDMAYFRAVENAITNVSNIKYLGYYSETNKVYNGIDILINNSLPEEGGEPLGTTIIEGLAYQKLVLASNQGGSSEIIENGYNGILFEPNNKTALEKALLEAVSLVANKQDNVLRKNAYTVFLTKFELSAMIGKYNAIIASPFICE